MVQLNNRILKSSKLTAFVLSIVFALIVFLLDVAGVLKPVSQFAYDGLFYIRTGIREPVDNPDSPVVIVGIDDKTFAAESFHIPKILWHEYFGVVINGIADGGARAVGLDFLLPQALFDELVPGYSQTWLKTFLTARRKNSPVVSGLVQMEDRQIRPEKRYLQILGAENIGLFNLTSDSDDFIRTQRLFFPEREGSEKGLYSITYLLAKAGNPALDITEKVKRRGYTVYIDYNPADVPFPRYSFSDVYEAARAGDLEYLTRNFKDKVILIGETDALTQDRHATPLYYVVKGGLKRTPGVEILAHTVNTLLNDNIFGTTPWACRLVLYVMLAAPICFVTLASKRRFWPLVFPAVLIGYSGISVWAYTGYVILPWAEGVIAATLAQAGAFSYRYLVADREKRHVRGAFSRYLSPHVVNQVIEHPELLALGGSRRVMTAFFSDLAGFTSISESLSPEELVRLLNRYLGLMTGAILELEGTLDKYEGDAIMAFWGAPLRQDDHAWRACLAALEQQRLLAGFREQVKREGLPEINVRMGINTGPMIVGNMGSEERFDYTIMGDAVNLASRLEGANKMYDSEIMISESTYKEVEELVEVRELDLIRVKGKKEPIRVYELLSEKGKISDDQAEIKSNFEKGLNLYRERRFAEAINVFETVLKKHPGDGPSRTYLNRCAMYMENPPEDGWDGVFTMTTK